MNWFYAFLGIGTWLAATLMYLREPIAAWLKARYKRAAEARQAKKDADSSR